MYLGGYCPHQFVGHGQRIRTLSLAGQLAIVEPEGPAQRPAVVLPSDCQRQHALAGVTLAGLCQRRLIGIKHILFADTGTILQIGQRLSQHHAPIPGRSLQCLPHFT